MSADRKRKARRAEVIRAYVGANGSGKTWYALYDLEPSLRAGRPVLSNTPILEAGTGRPHPGWIPLRSWKQLLEARNLDVLLDEVTGVASARSYATLPAQLLQVLVQLRKRNVTLSWTSPNFARADVVLREVTRGVVVCRGMFPKVDSESMWPQNRLLVARLYDAQDWEAISMSLLEKAKPKANAFTWRPRHPNIDRLYDTKAAVEILDHADLTGTCLVCNGKRTQHKCSCPPVDLEALEALEDASQPGEGDGSEATSPAEALADAIELEELSIHQLLLEP